MKKVLCLIMCVTMLLMIFGCKGEVTNNNSNLDKQFSQTMTLVTMPSPPKCKTTTDMTVINEVLNVLGEIEKGKMLTDVNGGWHYMIKLNVDGTELIYSVGGVFTDADGRQYEVLNSEKIKEKLNKIYVQLDVQEIDYP